jgi:peptidoglycan hydrolase-like protein with peptidoglycan-binding domain
MTATGDVGLYQKALILKAIDRVGVALLAVIVATVCYGAPSAADAGAGPIADVQARLAAQGYDPGPINGVMSAKTERALLVYRHAAGHPVATGLDADSIITAQAALARLGFLTAPADGKIGPQTRDAIVRFQAQNHLSIDPRVSDRLLAELDQAAAPPGSAASPPPEPSAPPPAEPEATGREPLPSGVTPPPIH